jgi:hypothetical protein
VNDQSVIHAATLPNGGFNSSIISWASRQTPIYLGRVGTVSLCVYINLLCSAGNISHNTTVIPGANDTMMNARFQNTAFSNKVTQKFAAME